MATSYDSSDAATRLKSVREAIDRCLKSQAYSVGARRQQMAELRELRAMERELLREVDQPSRMATLGRFTRPT